MACSAAVACTQKWDQGAKVQGSPAAYELASPPESAAVSASGTLALMPPQAGLGEVPQGAQNKAKPPCPSVTPKCYAPQPPGSGCAHTQSRTRIPAPESRERAPSCPGSQEASLGTD